LEQFKPVRAVYGNIDDGPMRERYPEELLFHLHGLKVYMTHIGGTPARYAPGVRARLKEYAPDLFICGHSHILKVMPDKSMGKMLFMNPGAAGQQGFHTMRTMLRFEIADGKLANLEVIELGRRGRQ
jgi:predicted phosphodiesterase